MPAVTWEGGGERPKVSVLQVVSFTSASWLSVSFVFALIDWLRSWTVDDVVWIVTLISMSERVQVGVLQVVSFTSA